MGFKAGKICFTAKLDPLLLGFKIFLKIIKSTHARTIPIYTMEIK